MTNLVAGTLRRAWAIFLGWAAAADYSAFDHINDRLRALESDMAKLKGGQASPDTENEAGESRRP